MVSGFAGVGWLAWWVTFLFWVSLFLSWGEADLGLGRFGVSGIMVGFDGFISSNKVARLFVMMLVTNRHCSWTAEVRARLLLSGAP